MLQRSLPENQVPHVHVKQDVRVKILNLKEKVDALEKDKIIIINVY